MLADGLAVLHHKVCEEGDFEGLNPRFDVSKRRFDGERKRPPAHPTFLLPKLIAFLWFYFYLSSYGISFDGERVSRSLK